MVAPCSRIQFRGVANRDRRGTSLWSHNTSAFAEPPALHLCRARGPLRRGLRYRRPARSRQRGSVPSRRHISEKWSDSASTAAPRVMAHTPRARSPSPPLASQIDLESVWAEAQAEVLVQVRIFPPVVFRNKNFRRKRRRSQLSDFALLCRPRLAATLPVKRSPTTASTTRDGC